MFKKQVKKLLALFLTLLLMAGMIVRPDYTLKTEAASDNWSSYITEPAMSDASTYTINNARELAWVASQVNSGNKFTGKTIKLMSDINLSDYFWIPIGNPANAFNGTFDGNNKVVSGLKIGSAASPDATLRYVGLFGNVDAGTIKAIGLENVAIYSSYSISITDAAVMGGIAGYVKGTTTLSGCYATGFLNSSNSYAMMGGILGYYEGSSGPLTAKNCYSQCIIYAPKLLNAGNFAGYIYGVSGKVNNITNCFATGSIFGGVNSSSNIGGFVGRCSYTKLNNCFSNCIINGKSGSTGGFTGYSSNSTYANIYASGTSVSSLNLGGVIGNGYSKTSNSILNCYWNSATNTHIAKGIGNPYNISDTTSKKSNMQSSSFLNELVNNANALIGAGNSDIVSWVQDSGKNAGYPRLSGIGDFATIYKPIVVDAAISGTVKAGQTLTLGYTYLDMNGYLENNTAIQWYRSDNSDGSGAVPITDANQKTYILTNDDVGEYIYALVTPSNGSATGTSVKSGITSQVDGPYFAGGSGTNGDPYKIETLAQLKNVTKFPSAYFELEKDITGLNQVLCDGLLAADIFSGDFDGNGHTVTLAIKDSPSSYLGMFGVIEKEGNIHDLNLKGSVSGSGSVSSLQEIGSLAGLNKGTITNCNSSVAVSATGSSADKVHVGGLVADNMQSITDCTVTGAVYAYNLTGTDTTSIAIFGGIAGANYSLASNALIKGCHTDIDSFSVNLASFYQVYAGGLVGLNNDMGSIEDAYTAHGLSCSLTTGNEASVVCTGGLAGQNISGNISRCYATGDVTGSGKCTVYTGGIAGQCSANPVYTNFKISESYYSGAVTGNGDSSNKTCVGGLAGYFDSGYMDYCYCTGSVTGNGGNNGIGIVYTGGLIGNYNIGSKTGDISNCYTRSSGTATGGGQAFNGGLCGGGSNTDSHVISCFWNITNTTATNGDDEHKSITGIALSTMQMTGSYATCNMTGLDFTTPYFVTKDSYLDACYFPQLNTFANSTDGGVRAASLESVTASVYSSAISPTTAVFDLNNPTGVNTTVIWGSAKSVANVVYEPIKAFLLPGAYSINKDTLTIGQGFLEGLNLANDDTVELNVFFDTGSSAKLTIKAQRNYVPGTDTSLSNLTVGGSTVSGFKTDQYEYNVELPDGTQAGSPAALVGATPADPKATVNITQAAALPGTATVSVTSEDTKTTQSYTIHLSLANAPAPTYKLTITAGTGGSITSGANGNYAAGTIINIAAAANADYSFYTWSSDGGSLGNPTSASTTYTMPAKSAAISASFSYIGNNSGGSNHGSSSNNNSSSAYHAVVSGNNLAELSLPVSVAANTATVDIGNLSGDIFSEKADTVVTIPNITGVDSYNFGIPVALLSSSQREGVINLSTNLGNLTIPDNMLAGRSGIEGTKAVITITRGDKSSLPEAVRKAIGDRPLVQLTLRVDGKQIEWNNPHAPVTITIPYTPTEAELVNPEAIVVWYIDGSGNAVSVPNGHYDPAAGAVTFTTTHFSSYAVGFNKVSFTDVAETSWYSKAVGFIAARGITTGTGNGKYNPEAKLTRGEFLVMMLRAYGVKPDANIEYNFADAGNTYYTGYLATARRLGISGGTGNNRFEPDKEITRQEMFTLLYNYLKVNGQLPQGNTRKSLSSFSDAGQIEFWAKEAMSSMIETGAISGSNNMLFPANSTTRAEMAQVLYNLFAK